MGKLDIGEHPARHVRREAADQLLVGVVRHRDVERRLAQLDSGNQQEGQDHAGQLDGHELRRCEHAGEGESPGDLADGGHHENEERLGREQDHELALGAGEAVRRVHRTRGQDEEEGRKGDDEGDEDQVGAAKQQRARHGHEADVAQEQRLHHGVDLARLLLQELLKKLA